MRTFFAGISCVCAGTVTHPVDTMKIRLQLQGEGGTDGAKKYRNIFHGASVVAREEGIKTGLYKGITASWLRESSYSSIRLGLYEPFKKMLGATDPHNTPFIIKMVAGSMSGLVGSALANPTDLIKVRMQAW